MKNTQRNYYLYGVQPSIEILNNPERCINNVLITEEIFKKYKKLISKFPYKILSPQELQKYVASGINHQNFIVNTAPLPPKTLEELTLTDPNSKVALLEEITDPRNIGAIIRSAAAFGLEAVILPHNNTPAENPAMIKAACGGFEKVKIIRVNNIVKSMQQLQKYGYWSVGLDEHASESLKSTHMEGKALIALGSEEKGLKKLTKQNCDFLAKINTRPEFPSLNVSNAAAIVFSKLDFS